MHLKYITITFLIFILSKSLLGCSCGFMPVDIVHINSMDCWIKGVVIERTIVEGQKGSGLYKYKVEIKEVYKGKFTSSFIHVFSNFYDSMCGVRFELSNESIYLFLRSNGKDFFTDLCCNNILEKYVDSQFEDQLNDYINGDVQVWRNYQGQIIGRGKLKNGYPIGKWEERLGYLFNSKEIGRYKKGKRNGVWKIYDLGTGEVIKKVRYKYGVQIKNSG